MTAPYVVSLAVGRPDITARNNFVGLFVVLPASVIAVYFFGLSGAGFSWVVYHIFAYSYWVPRICRECLGMPATVWYWHVLRILGSAILIYGCAWIALASLGTFSVTALAAAYVLATLVYGVVAFWIMGEELRQGIIDFVNPLRLKMREAVVPD